MYNDVHIFKNLQCCKLFWWLAYFFKTIWFYVLLVFMGHFVASKLWISELPLSLTDHFKTTFISRDGWKLLLIPSPCNCQADIFLMGLHSTITRTPLLNEKPVTKWRRRTLADPILRDWHCLAKKCMSLRVVFKNSAVFANKLGHTRVHLTAVWTPHS